MAATGRLLSAMAGVALTVALGLAASACRQEPVLPQPPATLLDPAPGTSLWRVLDDGETHDFAIDLEAGHYLQLRVDQQGVDVSATLADPDGRPLVTVDNVSGADGSQGPERIAWVTATADRYSVTLHARSGWRLPGHYPPGRYMLTIEALRPATGDDRRRAAAETAIAEGDVLYWRLERQTVLEAIPRFEEALAGFRVLGVPSRQADATLRLAMARQFLDEPAESERAYELYQRAGAFYETSGNERQLALTLHERCRISNSRRRMTQALDEGRRALALWERTGDLRGKALTFNELGLIHRRLGDGHRAVSYYDQALGLWRQQGDRLEEALALHNRGRIYATLGKREQAAADLLQALAIQRQVARPRAVCDTLSSLGLFYSRYREAEEASRYYHQALEVAETGRGQEGRILTGIARIEAERGETGAALASYRRAGEIFRREGDHDWAAQTHQGIARLLTSEDQPRQALAYFERALALQEGIQHRTGMASTLLGMAAAERRLENLDQARHHAEEAVDLVESLRTAASAGGDLRAYYFARKQDVYELYVDLLMDLHRRHPEEGYAAAALTASELSRARSLLELLGEAGGEAYRGVAPALLEQEQDLKTRINAKELERAWLLHQQAASDDALATVQDEQRELLRRYEQLRDRIRAESPRDAALIQPRPLTAAEIQRRVLDPGTLLLEYKLGEERSFLWALTPDALEGFVLPGRAAIETATRRLYGLITRKEKQRLAQRRIAKELAGLSQILLDPVAAELEGAQRLMIVADGALQYLPFGALPLPRSSPPEPLVTQLASVTMPSASALAMVRDLPRRTLPRRTLAVLADPVFSGEDPRLAGDDSGSGAPRAMPAFARDGRDVGAYRRLAFSRLEADGILSLVPPAERFSATGFDATRELVFGGELADYLIVHFATHGEIDAEHPELSRLVLSLRDREGSPRDGLLHAYEIYNLRLGAELVVLSACETALGRQIRGEGHVGLTRGFLHAGAPRVVVSLWKVDDRATAELMQHFYRRLLLDALAPAAALREAQDAIRRQARWQPPYYWAGFVLQGDWRDVPRGNLPRRSKQIDSARL